MDWISRELVYLVGSGQALFAGTALLLVVVLLDLSRRSALRRAAEITFLLALSAIVLSSAAIPWLWYAGLGCADVGWLIAHARRRSGDRGHYHRLASLGLVAAALGLAWAEYPYHLLPRADRVSDRSIAVIGDSLAAGIGENDGPCWPARLGSERQLDVQNRSQAGSKVADAVRLVHNQPITASLVLVEIGGNDLLGGTKVRKFESDLDTLLGSLKAPGRQIVMLELPLPPFRHAYGYVQRGLARRHRVLLVSKWVLMRVLSTPDATTDSIHLSAAGHRQLADQLWPVIESAYP